MSVTISVPFSTTFSSSANIFPLSVSSNSSYLKTSAGNLHRLKVDAGWVNYMNFSVADQNSYLNGLVSAGFNGTTLMGLVKNSATWYNVNEPNNFDGDAPFTGTAFLTPNSTYFTKLSDYIDRCKARNLSVMFFHTYVGYNGGGDGWETELSAITNAQAFTWGAYLATTFTQPNIIWMHGGDHTMSGTALARFQQVVAGIQSISRNRIAGAEWDSPNTIITAQTGFIYGTNPATSDMQLSSFYGQGALANGRTYVEADLSYEVSAAGTCGPAYQTEPNYINAWYDTKNSRSDIRSMICWALTSGAYGGTNFGEDNRWNGNPAGMLSSFSSNGTADMSRINALFDSLSWSLFRPSGTSSNNPIRGAGSYTGYCGRLLITTTNNTDDSFIASSLSSDGNQLLAYIPPTGTTGTTFSVDFRSMSGTCTAYWFNLTTAGYTAIGTFANSLSAQSFTTPGDNGTGTNDWFLVCKVPS